MSPKDPVDPGRQPLRLPVRQAQGEAEGSVRSCETGPKSPEGAPDGIRGPDDLAELLVQTVKVCQFSSN